MIRNIHTDGNKRVVFYHYDESLVGIFIFAINVPPYTYDKTVYFPRHPGHQSKFSQDFGFFPKVNSIAYVGSRAGTGVIYRYDLENNTKLDVGYLSTVIGNVSVHPKLGYGFADGF